MKKIIADNWDGTIKEMAPSSHVVFGSGAQDQLVKLTNGVCLRDFGQGRFINNNDALEHWAPVLEWDADLDYAECVGFTRLDG